MNDSGREDPNRIYNLNTGHVDRLVLLEFKQRGRMASFHASQLAATPCSLASALHNRLLEYSVISSPTARDQKQNDQTMKSVWMIRHALAAAFMPSISFFPPLSYSLRRAFGYLFQPTEHF